MLPVARLSRDKIVLCAILLAMLVLGGASRPDAMSQAFVRAAAICGLVAVFWRVGQPLRLDARQLLWLLSGWTGLMAIQLVPLPPGLWSALPGRDLLTEFYAVTGAPQPWRPVSLQPHLTFNSLLAMLVPWAALLIAARLRNQDFALELTLMAFLVLTVAFGALQMASGGRAFYFYDITNIGSAVGLFSNRNHNAFVVVMIMPLLTRMLLRRTEGHRLPPASLALVGGASFAVLITILVIGSRMGLVLWLVGLVASWALVWDVRNAPARSRSRARPDSSAPSRGKTRLLLTGGAVAAGLAMIVAVLVTYQERFTAFQRLAGSLVEEERLAYVPVIVEVAEKYMPAGAGFGTFASVFKIAEPDEMLRLAYLNHAHNDLLEIVVEGGAIAVLLVFAFVALWALRGVTAFLPEPRVTNRSRADQGRPERMADQNSPVQQRIQARLGWILGAILLIGSVTDYPLRAPACAAIFAIACYWLFRSRDETARAAAPLTTGK